MTSCGWEDLEPSRVSCQRFVGGVADARRAGRVEAFAELREMEDSLEDPDETAAASTTALSIREITRRLNAALGGTLVAALAGTKDTSAPRTWAKEGGPQPRPAAMKRLAFAYEQWQKIAAVEGEQVARLWFIGANPLLSNDTPANAIRDGSFDEVRRAVHALIDDAFSG
jgi:hypothetical protein